jgi:hypothetical protein
MIRWCGLLVAWLAAACGGDDGGAAACDAPRLSIASPADGETIGPGDDVDGTMPGTQIEFAIDACGFERDDTIKLYMLAPVESDYGFGTFYEDGTVFIRAPASLPGTNTFEARSVDDTVRSAPVSIDVRLM